MGGFGFGFVVMPGLIDTQRATISIDEGKGISYCVMIFAKRT